MAGNNEQMMRQVKPEPKERKVNRTNRKVQTAGFRVLKTLEDYVWTPAPNCPTA